MSSKNVRPNYITQMDRDLNALKQLSHEHEGLFKDYYRIEDHKIYIKADYFGQGTNNLYRLALIHGPFSEMEISTIAKQLLDQVHHIHKKGIKLYHVNPQSIFVLDGLR